MSQTTTGASNLDPSEWPTPAEAHAKPKRASVRPLDSSSPQTQSNTVASTPPKGYYVILGRGLAAVLNHATLRQSAQGKLRLADPRNPSTTLPILHIGLDDPWMSYHPHGMGQPPYLLTMPAFHNRPTPTSPTIRSGMRSTAFAAITKAEWTKLKNDCPFEHKVGFVPIIQPRAGSDKGADIDQRIIDALTEEGLSGARITNLLERKYPDSYPPFRLLLVRGYKDMELVYAFKIDLCTGAGRPTIPDIDTCWSGRTQLWTTPANWDKDVKHRRVVNGPEALCTHTPWNATDRFLVYGAGGIGLNQVERAEDTRTFIDWLPRSTLHGTFNLERNDTVLKHSKAATNGKAGKTMLPGESGVRSAPGVANNTKVPLYPADENWRFGQNASLDSVTPITGSIQVRVKPTDTANPSQIIDHDENPSLLTNAAYPFSTWYAQKHAALDDRTPDKDAYTRLVLCIGVNADTALGVPAALGCPITVAAALTFQRVIADGRSVALESKEHSGAVRILGAAHAIYPVKNLTLAEHKPTNDYFTSLPVSAVPPGFIYAGVTIAAANGWFKEPNCMNLNVNTIEQGALIDQLSKDMHRTDAEKLAKHIVAHRRARNGYTDLDDLANQIDSEPSLRSLPAWKTAVSKLATAYAPPPDWWT